MTSIRSNPAARSDLPPNLELAPKSTALLALLLLVPAPTIGVIVAMMLPATQGTDIGKAVYAFSKIWILLLPLIWSLWVERSGIHISKPWRSSGLVIGATHGLLIAGAIIATYAIIGTRLINVDQMRQAATTNGIGTPGTFLAFVAGLALVNSLLEEYVWRWFVFRQCERLTNGPVAVVMSAFCFTLHHFFALIAQTTLSVTLLGSLGVFIGGCAWSWCYLRFRSIWPGWVSHVIVDAAVFGVGWKILFGS